MSDLVSLAWAAGLFEGEGCFHIQKASPRPGRQTFSLHLQASLASTDQDVVEMFHRVIGLGRVSKANRRPKRPHHKPQWRWYANGEDVERVYALIGPWLGERRRARYAEILIQRREYERDRDARAHNYPRYSVSEEAT